MPADRVLRAALWASVAYNALGAAALLWPRSALGRLAGLPAGTPFFYRAELAWVVALFGGVYWWLARRPVLDAAVVPVVALAAIGKAGFFAVYVAAWARGEVPVLAVVSASGDLILALVFGWWLQGRGRAPAGATRASVA